MRIGDALLDAVDKHMDDSADIVVVDRERLHFIIKCFDFIEANFVVTKEDGIAVLVGDDHTVIVSIASDVIDFEGDCIGIPELIEDADIVEVRADDEENLVLLTFMFANMIEG